MIKIPGTVTTVDANTGEEIKTEPMHWNMLPPAAHLCQECAVDHTPDQPHNQQSLFYQMKFNAEHGRYPTWADAMAHCDEGTRKLWTEELRRLGADV
jgi:hypothetical protein